MTRQASALLLATVLLGCARARIAPREVPPPVPGVPAGLSAAPEGAEIVCAADRLGTLRARFRATVRAAGEEMAAQGVLLVRRPGGLRVKLFGVAGLTVHDAVWVGDASQVRGAVRGLGTPEPLLLEQTPARPLHEPAARLSLLLWSLWQPRCASPPRPGPESAPLAADAGVSWVLDPSPAQARRREVVVAEGEPRTETLRTADGERLTVRSSDFDRSLRPPLPRRIELEAPTAGWSAEIEVADYALEPPLADGLFALPGGAAALP